MFVEYLSSDFQRDTTPNVVQKLKATIDKIDTKVGFKCITSFISDSCNGMSDVRKVLMKNKLVRWKYGCEPHCINNFCQEIGKVHSRK